MRHQDYKEAQKHYFNLKLQNIACNLYKGNHKKKPFWRSCLHVAGDFGRFQNSHGSMCCGETTPGQVMAPYSADYPKVIIHPTDTCKFRLELCDEQDGYGYAVFFSTGRTTRTEEKNQEHDEENSEVNQRSEELRRFKAFFWEWPMNFVPKTTCVFLVSKRFSLKKEINPSR